MNLFGCKFCNDKTYQDKCPSNEDEVKDRKNFDSLLWAIVTVFQVFSFSKMVMTRRQRDKISIHERFFLSEDLQK